jgi:hypothetical protein
MNFKHIALVGVAGTLVMTTGCGFAAGTLAGSSMWGDGHAPWAQPTLQNLGSSVVCVGSTADVDADSETFDIRGTVTSTWEAPARGFDNIIPCAEQPEIALEIEDDNGDTWTVGYAWKTAQGWDNTPWIDTWEGDRVRVYMAQGEGESAGFAVFRTGRLVYAMESGVGGNALVNGDIDGLEVQIDDIVGTVETPCGDRDALSVEYSSDDDRVVLFPDEDGGFRMNGSDYTACNITSFEMHDNGDCDDDSSSDTSWVVFDRAPTGAD